MSQAPRLLNDDGTASMATLLLMSHHAFRRDIVRFIQAVAQIKAGDISRVDAVHGEWKKSYRQFLHGHHIMEDTNIFPDIKSKHPDLASALDTLTAQHHTIDPVLERGDMAFADLVHSDQAVTVLDELKALLDEHLAFEEAEITPFLRDNKEFSAPADGSMIALYAAGFAWSMQGIAPEVLEEVRKMLPDNLLEKLSVAQAEFETHSERVWGTYKIGSATSSIPEGY